MTTPVPPPSFSAPPAAAPFALVGRAALQAFAYVGALASVPVPAARFFLRRAEPGREEVGDALGAQLAWMFGMGLPLVGLLHVGMGSFLAMQSYFGGTFADGTGAVVGVGLLRNLAPLMSGLVMAGLVAARVVPELRARARAEVTGSGGLDLGLSGRAAGARLAAAAVAGPVLAVWGAAVGTAVGWQVAKTLMGVSTHSFFHMFWEMLWARDLTGVLVKGVANGLFAGLFACHEGLRGSTDDDLGAVSAAACRAACFASVAVLAVNSAWFILVYHAGPAFGPTLLTPPGS